MAISKRKKELIEAEAKAKADVEAELLKKARLDAEYPIMGEQVSLCGKSLDDPFFEGPGIDKVIGVQTWQKICAVENNYGSKTTYAMPCAGGVLVENIILFKGQLATSLSFIPGGTITRGRVQ